MTMTQVITTFLQQQALMLMQAMLGVISPNFRMISITMLAGTIQIKVVLECESEEDREELEDCQSEFEALQSEQINYDFEVVVYDGDIEWPSEPAIVIYRRREG